MINIYRSEGYDSEINVFHGRDWVKHDEILIIKRMIFGEEYVHAEPVKPGFYAFGGTFLHTSNGIFPDYNRPVPLHDRDMSLER